MTSAVERLRARVAARKLSESDSEANRVAVSGTSDTVPRFSTSKDFETSKFNLRLACYLNIRARKECYPDYMRVGFAVTHALVSQDSVERWFKNYCLEPYPDVCRCGQVYLSNAGTVRSHCTVCKGDIRKIKIDGYTAQRLSLETGIHYSWIEYGIAWALEGKL